MEREIRQRITVQGVVQGVGFRPFVYGLATRLKLSGFVGNDSQGVFVEVEGPPEGLARFLAELEANPPPLAHIEQVTVEPVAVTGEPGFIIVPSQGQTASHTLISPDLCICDDCLRELFDPDDRRYRYPFINCTNCGPRFTIIRDIPYDRPLTTMAAFPMCPDCQREYDDPLDRRFHAQPNACPVCGPEVWLEIGHPEEIGEIGDWGDGESGDEAVDAARALLAAGKIVAVKGLGGFHLACDATDDAAVETLRVRKGRVDKPFAIMVRDVETAERIAHLDDQERALLTGRERPIVLLRKRADSPLSGLVAPGNNFVGVMLPYTPLHYLLLDRTRIERIGRIDADFFGEHVPGTDPDNPVALQSPGPSPARSPDQDPCAALVMTSGNYSDEPIVKDNDEARRTLGKLADALLLHNRAIHARCDDSVIRVFQTRELPVRRSRGYAPFPVKLPFDLRPTLATGGELKATFCLTAGDHAFMSQHIGDMENLETLEAFSQAVDHFETIFRTRPEILACDRHPGYLSTRWAKERAGDRPLIQVQHHHAHIAALMAEAGLDGEEPVIGVSFDGTGYGDDGAIWGGELLVADYRGYERLAHLAYVPLPGGDAAVKRPYRTALAHLALAGVKWMDDLPPVQACPPTERNVLARQIERGFNAVPTSSMGRLFDAVAALAGVRQQVTYEAQAAIELEALAGGLAGAQADGYQFGIDRAREPWRFEAAPVIRSVVEDVRAGVPAAVIGDRFHRAVADLILELSLAVRAERGLNRVALSGGVFQNVTLLHQAVERLNAADFDVLVHRLVPPNDGGLALGQAMIANRIERGLSGLG